MKRHCLLLASLVFSMIITAQDTTQQITPGRKNAANQINKPYVILISADGFRHDFAEKYQAKNLLALRKKGATASYMQASFPSLTFPNHYTLVTGQYPAHHGLLENTFVDRLSQQTYSMNKKEMVADPQWYGGTPLWVLAEQQQMLSASFYWVASEAPIQRTPITYFYKYNDIIPAQRRIQAVKDWLALPDSVRPHFITFYFPQVDHEAHTYGPDSKETADAVHYVDEQIGLLNEVAEASGLPVNFVFVSDHGMTEVDNQHPLTLPKELDRSQFIATDGSALVSLYIHDSKNIKPIYEILKKKAGKDYDVYLYNKLPAKLKYNKIDDPFYRVGDIVLLAKLPKVFSITGRPTTKGKHGYDPSIPDMRASFQAWGPAFKPGVSIGGFENIHVYPLIAEILQLQYDPKAIDGKRTVLAPILK
jgi:predicted AlkP superfamily pyrophosphatase or phosphodiesterase